LFQPDLFPGIEFGLASSPWAQAYAAGGLGLVAVFAIGFAAVLAFFGWLIGNLTGPLLGAVAAIAAWCAFFFQRNDLMVQAGIVKMSIIILTFAVMVTWIGTIYRQRFSGSTVRSA
jgi:hypothetical protein